MQQIISGVFGGWASGLVSDLKVGMRKWFSGVIQAAFKTSLIAIAPGVCMVYDIVFKSKSSGY